MSSSTPKKTRDPRNGLRMSATLATVFTILGHTVFGFEQSWAQVVVALLTGYGCALFFEWVDARANGTVPGYQGGGLRKAVDFMLSAHMTSITMSFLLFVNQRLWIMAFAVALAIGSKYVLRVRQNGRLQHFMNPSNLAIAVVLIVYQWTGILPWAFTTNLMGAWDWIVPLIIVGLGMRLNLLFTGRLPTILSWLGTFILLGAARAWYFGSPVLAELVPLTGIAFVLFTFYMITDPQTSPSRVRSQFFFGAGIALAYSVLLMLHVQYTMFYSVTVIAATRGMYLYFVSRRVPAAAPVPVPVGPVRMPEGAAAMRRGDRSAGAA
ncbi:MAG TPA: enediyne biosynthesis protein UnbU [Thermoanaerobaculia bacterium]|nr:enediyne biosynthesis protein UnbU [Thermoanaerobaculia bacterium]